MRKTWRIALAAVSLGLVALVVAACGSSGSKSGTTGSSVVNAKGTNGPGYNAPTAPAGAKIKGGTVTYTEGPSAPPNYIFPMTSAQVCGTNNLNQLSYMLYRPLYWYGNNYDPTVDYNYSIGEKPVVTNGGKTFTIHMKPWMWSNGEPVTARDVVFWINMYKASPTTNYCGFVPGRFPQNLTSVSTPNEHTLVLTFNKVYDPEWVLYNELSQLFPVPMAWDRTSLSQAAPSATSANLPDTTTKGAEAVYTFLNAQSKKVGTWATSPIWSVVDGPFKLQSFTSNGQVTLVPNAKYSGSPKPTISKFVELPFTSDTAVFNEIRSGGPSAVTIANLPPQYEPQVSTVEGEGYTLNRAASYSFNYFPLNLHNPKLGPTFSQLYFRQAFQHLIDQTGWIKAFLNNSANPTYSPIPPAPNSSLVSTGTLTNPYPFSIAAAKQLLVSHGWDVKPGGTTTCAKPGSAADECGAGVKAGTPLAFNIDYQSGVTTLTSEMANLQSDAKQVGIEISLTNHPFDDVIGTAIACTASQPTCKWTAENWGAGWIYGPDYLPTGESLFQPGAVADYGSYGTTEGTKLINETVFGSLANEKKALTAYSLYMRTQVPVVYGPTSIGTYQGDGGTLVSTKLGGYAANALGLVNPENWYLTK